MKRLFLLTLLLAVCATAAAETEKRPTKIWNRTGPLGDTPKHVTHAFPLSDQENKGGWVKFEPMTDEFEGKELDRSKWIVHTMRPMRVQSAFVRDENITVSDGKLHLTMRTENLWGNGKELGYTSAAIGSKARTAYGYFEVKAKPMASAVSSAFSFREEDTPEWLTEIDVFEIGGKAKGFERKYNMNLQVHRTPQEENHWDMPHTWVAPWRLADDYHVYGLEWDKGEIKFYVDGVVVRTVENTHWHQPLCLGLDVDTMPELFGMPDNKDLPATFSIKYVRAWKAKSATSHDEDDPLGKKLSDRVGPFPQGGILGFLQRGEWETWKKKYEKLSVDEKVHYCVFQLRNECWFEHDRMGGDGPYSTGPEGSPRHELVRLGKPAIPQLLLALDSKVSTEIHPWRHVRRNWLVQDAALDVIEDIACRCFAGGTRVPKLSDIGEKKRQEVLRQVAEWWAKNKDFDDVQWAKDALFSEKGSGSASKGLAIASLYRRLGKESYPFLAKAYHCLPKGREDADVFDKARGLKVEILQFLLKSPTASEKPVFVSAVHDAPLWVRIDGAEGLWAIGNSSGLEAIIKETAGRLLKDTGSTWLDSEYCNLVSFLRRCNTPSSRDAICKCLRGQNPYLCDKAIDSVPELHMEKAVRALPELFDNLFVLSGSYSSTSGNVTRTVPPRRVCDDAAETFTKVVPDAPRFDGTTTETQQSSIEKLKRWWKANGSKLNWDEKRGVLVLPTAILKSDQEQDVAAEIARLGKSSKSECAAAVKALIKIGKPAAPALVKVLSDARNDVRAFAAEALRGILAADPKSAPNCHDEAFWKRRLVQLKRGMALDEALKVLLPELPPAERQKTCDGSHFSGGSGTSCYRLDDYWAVDVYLVDEGHKLHNNPTALFRSVRGVWVAPPAKYTGEWVTWYVNGQKADEIQYRNGQYDGTFNTFSDDGSKSIQEHFTAGVCHGTDTGWHRNGKKSYEGQIDHGKQAGTWTWWNENGQIEAVEKYESGKRIEKTD